VPPPALPARPVFALDEALGRAISVGIELDGPAPPSTPCLASVPLPREAGVRSAGELALIDDAGTAIPCQPRILSRWDARPDDATALARWVLLAFESNGSRHIRLTRRTNGPTPEPCVSVASGVEGHVLLDTGTIKTELGGPTIVGHVTDEKGSILATAIRPLPHPRETPNVEILESGPVRAIVRVSGNLGWRLGYALLVEAWAGRSELRLALETRNSDPYVARTVELGEFGIDVEGKKDGKNVRFPTTPKWRHYLLDLQHRTDQTVVSFADSAAGTASAIVHGRPDATWVRDAGGFMGPLPDPKDERAAYMACGLEAPAPETSTPALAPQGGAMEKAPFEVEDVSVKWDTETDDARDAFALWLRTGDRAAFEEGCGWARFYRDRAVRRADGAAFDLLDLRPTEDKGEVAKLAHELSGNRMDASHVYGEGLVGCYLLTGDRASLEAARDLAASCERRFKDVGPDTTIVELRDFARPLQLFAALYEATHEDHYREICERFTSCAFSGPVRDRALGCYAFKMYDGEMDFDSCLPKGFSLPERFPKDAKRGLFRQGPRKIDIRGERACWPFQDVELAHALARVLETTGDERARSALVGLAEYYLVEGLVPAFHDAKLEMTPYFTVPYVPEPEVGRVAYPSSPLYSTNLGLIEGAAYLVTGDPRFLDLAKRCLRVAALRGHGELRPIDPEERRVRMPTAEQWTRGFDDERTFVALGALGGKLEPPASPTDVRVLKGPREGTVEVSFEPGDARAARWVVLGARSEIVARKPARDQTAAFSAEPLAADPFRRAEGRIVLVVTAPDELRAFAVRAVDARGVCSAVSPSASR
jgi:hypothetical protein